MTKSQALRFLNLNKRLNFINKKKRRLN